MTIDRLRAEMARQEDLPPAERRKLGRTLGHMAMELEKADALQTQDDMDLAIGALAIGAGVHSYPQRYHMSRARLMQKRRDILGLSEPVIAAEKAMTLDVEAGGVAISDMSLERDMIFKLPPQTRFADWMAEHRFYFVSFGGDGAVKTRLRIHQIGPVEPQSHEFRRLREATPEGCVAVVSGQICVNGGGSKSLKMAAPNGLYRIAAYGLGIGRNPECLILLSPLAEHMPAPLTDTPELAL